MHNAALASAHLALRYEVFDVDPSAFDGMLERLRLLRAAGNVTVPYKERMFRACDELTPLAQRVGAVNTFWFDDDARLIGENTDVGGFSTAAIEFIGKVPSGLSIGVLGAGGAAAAVLAAVEQWDDCLAHVYNRTPERARLLCERFGAFAQPVDDVGAIAGAHIVVNATTIGLRPDEVPIDPALIPAETWVMDLIPKRGETRLVRELRVRGVRTSDGLPMLVEQAALAFERWFALSPSRALMRSALDEP
jgi:shikimate dehydrogenase